MVQCYSTGHGNVSFHKGTLAPRGECDWTCASFGQLESTTETGNGSVQPFLHSLRHKVPILYNGRHCPPELPLPMGDLDLPYNTWCFRPIRVHNPNGTSIGSVTLHRWPQSVSIQWFACSPLKIVPSHVGIWTSCNTWFIGSTLVRNANGNLIVSAIFAGLTGVTDWQSDRQTGRPRYLVWCGVIMRNYVGYGKTTKSFHVSTNNFATIKSLSVRSKHLIKYLV